MKVLITTSLAPESPSGVVTYYQTLVSDLAAEGIHTDVIHAHDTPLVWKKVLGVLKRITALMGTTANMIYAEFAYFTGAYLAVYKVRGTAFDLIHAQDVRSGMAAYLALGKKVPVVLTCHFNDDPVTESATLFSLGPWFTSKLTAWYRYLFTAVTNYVFVSNYAYSKSKHLLPPTIHKRILYNTVDLKMSAEDLKRPASGRLVISNVGHIDERKNQQLLIQIAHELRSRNSPDFSIWLIGDGPKRAEYEQLVKTLGLTEQVTFYGHQSAPWRLVAQSDLYVHTALNDNCPYSIIEAFAVKTPVLALPVGGIPELVTEQAGQLHGQDVVSITDELVYYFDSEKRTQLAREQARYAQTKFNHRANLAALISFYQQVAGQPEQALSNPVLQ